MSWNARLTGTGWSMACKTLGNLFVWRTPLQLRNTVDSNIPEFDKFWHKTATKSRCHNGFRAIFDDLCIGTFW
jgi:hypothetical protein